MGNPFLKEFFGFEEKIFEKNLGRQKAERRKEGTTERGNNWNDTTSALFKNLVIYGNGRTLPSGSTSIQDPFLGLLTKCIKNVAHSISVGLGM